jgi:hypothetical protein
MSLKPGKLQFSVVQNQGAPQAFFKPARNLLQKNGGDRTEVPKWPSEDFDRVYVLHIRRSDRRVRARFERLNKGLDGQLESCPL